MVQQKGKGNVHFVPQTDVMCLKAADYDYILPLELSEFNDNSLVAGAWEKIGKKNSVFKSYDGIVNPKEQTSTKRARELLMRADPELIEQFYEIYKADFMLMNYSNFTDPEFPLPLHS